MNDTLLRWVSSIPERFVALKTLHQMDIPNVKYQYFDFHHECRQMRWDRISVLIDRIKEDIDREGRALPI